MCVTSFWSPVFCCVVSVPSLLIAPGWLGTEIFLMLTFSFSESCFIILFFLQIRVITFFFWRQPLSKEYVADINLFRNCWHMKNMGYSQFIMHLELSWFLSFLFSECNMNECLSCICIYVSCVYLVYTKVRKRCLISRMWNYRGVWIVIWVLGLNPGPLQ